VFQTGRGKREREGRKEVIPVLAQQIEKSFLHVKGREGGGGPVGGLGIAISLTVEKEGERGGGGTSLSNVLSRAVEIREDHSFSFRTGKERKEEIQLAPLSHLS